MGFSFEDVLIFFVPQSDCVELKYESGPLISCQSEDLNRTVWN